MKLLLFGATGMVGGGALREALADPSVTSILTVSRKSCGIQHSKLKELLLTDLFHFAAVEKELVGWDACVWGLGISSIGMDEAQYAKVTEELTLLWARTLLRLNPKFSFCYCSAAGADGPGMWAKVRRRVEGALKAMPFHHAGVVRPFFIQPGPGIRSHVRLYQVLIEILRPLSPLFIRFTPQWATDSGRLGRAMLRVVQGKADRYILESKDINRLGA